MVEKIEIEFPLPIELSDDFYRGLDKLLTAECKAYETENPGRVMWVAGHGQKVNWSKVDALFMGKKAEPDAPDTGEPTYDASIYSVEVYEREKY